MDVLAREQRILQDQLASGDIDVREFNRKMRECELEYGAQAEMSAQRAHDEELERW